MTDPKPTTADLFLREWPVRAKNVTVPVLAERLDRRVKKFRLATTTTYRFSDGSRILTWGRGAYHRVWKET